MSEIVLTCPACATRYKADVESIGPNGRTVRCARCEEVWFQPSPDMVADAVTDTPIDPQALAHADNEQDDTMGGEAGQSMSPRHERSQSANSLPAGSDADSRGAIGGFGSVPVAVTSDGSGQVAASAGTVNPAASAGPSSITDESQASVAPLPDALGADVMMRDRADQAKLAKRRRTILIIWLVPLIIVLLAAIIAWTQRQAIVNRIPQMATLYQALGEEVRVGGLKLDPPSATILEEDGVAVIRIDSVLYNLTSKTLPVPLIELTLHDDLGQSLAQWYVEPSQTQIAPKGQIPISTNYTDPPSGAVGVRYRLMNEGRAA
ncbi:DUF3426 domain-containing protein [Algimonas porphyrae]|uniref:Thioredoxin n=1 Tax=Algimonas porphyrae TaxID=1128113 RepID=A0ABQ5UX54_9PROT|nr:DUF3426 domain-containing protein [Algimonas porphyrae]GLQ19738.1 thioredoxin [Algimonas porphyrae]